MRIALVDDDASIRRSVSRLLRSYGHECITYESAERALADHDLTRMNCLLIDIELFGIDGFDLRDRLRDQGSTIPHIFITAHCASEIPDWDSRIGESPYIKKPVEESLLLACLYDLSQRKKIAAGLIVW